MRMKTNAWFILSAVLLCALRVSASDEWQRASAKRIVENLRSKKGIALDLGCGDSGLAIEVARQSELVVYCIEPDEKAVGATRRMADEAGLYGHRVSVRYGNLDKLPYPDLCMNLIICGDEFVNGKGSRDFKEIHRLLSPNGIAFVGQSEASARKGAPLSRAALEGWVKQAGIKSYEMIEKGGVWVKIRRPLFPGAQEWSHRSQGPGNPHGSNDTAIKPPFKTQWINQATDLLGNGFLLVAGGRQFVFDYSSSRLPNDTTPAIHAHDAYNGRLLWSRMGPKELAILRDNGVYTPTYVSSEAVATEKALYVLGGKTCAVFDADKGELVRSLPIPDDTAAGPKDIWLYVAYADGLLFGAAGPQPPHGGGGRFHFNRGVCHTVFALEPSTGKVVWKHASPLITVSLAIGGGRLYFLDTDKKLHALDIRSGKKLWASVKEALPEKVPVKLLTYYKEKVWIAGGPGGATGGVLNAVPVFSAADGKFLFDAEFPVQPANEKLNYQLPQASSIAFAGDFGLCLKGHSGQPNVKVDVETGKAVWSKKLGVYTCGPIMVTPEYAFGRETWADLETGKAATLGPQRSNCNLTAIPANGLLYVPAPGCTGCRYGFRGNIAFAHGTVSVADTPRERLVKGPAFGEKVAGSAMNGWVSWRNGPDRAGKTAEQASPPFKKIWTIAMADHATPVIVSDGLLSVGCMDHKLYGLDAATGKKKWQYFAEGEIHVAPWVWAGRIYVGDDQGWVHCVRASDGALVWKFHAALGDEQIFANGRLSSRWRAGCGVLVDDGTAYVTGGFYPEDGTAVYALDADTGTQKKFMKIPSAASGLLAKGKDRLYVPNQWDVGAIVELDGNREAAAKPIGGTNSAKGKVWGNLYGGPLGAHIMVLDDKVMVRSPDFRVIRDATFIDNRHTLPIVTDDSVYLRDGTFMTGEDRKGDSKPNGLEMVPDSIYTKAAIRFVPNGQKSIRALDAINYARVTAKTARWLAWKDQRMTAAIMAGDVLLSGGDGKVHIPASRGAGERWGEGGAVKVYATASESGAELWSAEVPGEVADLAFHDGRLFVVCKNPHVIVCFEAQGMKR